MKTRLIAVVWMGGMLAGASPALAQETGASWFAGVGVGRVETTFRPYYTYESGGTPDQYENLADGLQFELLAGRRHRLSERFSLVVQGTASFNSVSWSLSIPEEPAEFEYSLPYRFSLTVAPEVHFGRVSVFADLGGGLGRVREIKTSPSSSAYDFDKMRPTLNVGGGLRFTASTRTSVYVHVEHVRHASFEFDTFTPANVRVEHVKDAPRALGFTAGITRRF